MKSVLFEIARFAAWFGLMSFLVLWGFALIIPAAWAAIMSAVGWIVAGFMTYADMCEDVETFNAPTENVTEDIAAAVFGGNYRKDDR